jgi:hypothetical protein
MTRAVGRHDKEEAEANAAQRREDWFEADRADQIDE